MELIFQHRLDGDTYGLVLLDMATGVRRQLVDEVAWAPPQWSADGRWVRFQQDLGRGVLVRREVDVETGSVQDADDIDRPDRSRLPGYSGHGAFSPARRWIAYEHDNCLLCVARAGGQDAFALKLPFHYSAAASYWSPCGTKLAAHLLADTRTGAYVIDLRTGERRRVSPRRPTQANGWTDFFVNGWSPDGTRIVATMTRWHDPKTYDYEWYELWLLAADGTTTKRLTDDGRCRHAAIRPTGEAPPANGEEELTFAWARPLRRADDPPAAGVALAAAVHLHLETGPPYVIGLVVRTAGGELVHPVIGDCPSIHDAFARLDAFLHDNGFRPSDTFTVVLPRYATDDQDGELNLLRIAHLVLAETGRRLWRFDRDLPPI